MPSKDGRLHKLEGPVIVELGRRRLRLGEVMNLMPGTIIDLEKDAESELDLLVNNEVLATGRAVKVGENFGLRLSTVGSARQRAQIAADSEKVPSVADSAADALAEQLLAGQDL